MRECQCIGLAFLVGALNMATHSLYEKYKPSSDSIFFMEFSPERAFTNTAITLAVFGFLYYTIGADIKRDLDKKKGPEPAGGSGR